MEKIKKSLKKLFSLILFFTVIVFFINPSIIISQEISPSVVNQNYPSFNESANLLLEFLKIFFSPLNISSEEFNISLPSQQNPSPSISILPSSTTKLDYYIPFRDPTIKLKPDAKQIILNSWPNSQIQYFELIVSESISHQWNPAFVLALWVEETGASTRTKKENGGSGIPTASGSFSRGHLGCAPSQDQTINESLACLFKNFSHFSNDQFAEFMARYSGGPPDDPFANNPYFPKNIQYWYSKLSNTDVVFLSPTPYGYSSAKTGYQYFAQCDASPEKNWKNYPLPHGCTVCEAGCGPTTVAMIIGSYVDQTINPIKMVEIYKNKNKYAGCNGTRWNDAVAILKEFGLETTEEIVYNPPQQAAVVVKKIAPYIKNGWSFLALANFCDKGCGHFFWIVNVDESNNSIFTYDPAYGNGKSLPFNVTYGLSSKFKGFPLYRILIGVKPKI